jgi:urea transporter
MLDLIRTSQLYGFNNSSIGKICVAKFEEENGQIIIIQVIGIVMKTCVVFNVIVKKIKLKHPNLTSQILLECTFKRARICSFY